VRCRNNSDISNDRAVRRVMLVLVPATQGCRPSVLLSFR
jgi:hypothetical protein